MQFYFGLLARRGGDPKSKTRCILNASIGVHATCALYKHPQLYAACPKIVLRGIGP